MRILVVTSLYPLPTAPIRGLFVADQVALLREAGHEFRVLVPREWMPQLWEDRDPNFRGLRACWHLQNTAICCTGVTWTLEWAAWACLGGTVALE